MGNPCWVEKLREGLTAFTDDSIATAVMDGSDNLAERDEHQKAAWAKQAMEKLDRLVPDEDTRYEIMARCSCDCALPLVDDLRENWRKNQDIDDLLEKMYMNPFYVRPHREGNVLYFTKAPCHKEDFEKAGTVDDKRYHYCHCDWARAVNLPISPTHCFCSAGWYKGIFEGIFQRPVKVRLVKSVLQGDDVCEFAVYL